MARAEGAEVVLGGLPFAGFTKGGLFALRRLLRLPPRKACPSSRALLPSHSTTNYATANRLPARPTFL